MEQFIGGDAHKKFPVFAFLNEKGEYGKTIRVGHDREVFREFLRHLPGKSKIAIETSGSYYWLVDEMAAAAGHEPQLAHPWTAKRRMAGRHKTDKKDARGLAMLLRNGTLPVVWIPPRELQDQREMLRGRRFRLPPPVGAAKFHHRIRFLSPFFSMISRNLTAKRLVPSAILKSGTDLRACPFPFYGRQSPSHDDKAPRRSRHPA